MGMAGRAQCGGAAVASSAASCRWRQRSSCAAPPWGGAHSFSFLPSIDTDALALLRSVCIRSAQSIIGMAV